MGILFVMRRLVGGVGVVLLTTVFVFVLLRLVPGDPAAVIVAGTGGENVGYNAERVEEIRKALGLDRPVWVQLIDYLEGLASGDFGVSLVTGRPIAQDLVTRFPVTLEVALLSEVVAWLLALPLGIYAAVRIGSRTEVAVRAIAFVASSVPTYWTGLLVLLFALLVFGWRPPLGIRSPVSDPLGHAQQLILPVVVLGFDRAVGLSRFVRNAFLEVMEEPYVLVARAKGLSELVVLLRHVARNALGPIVSFSGLRLGYLLGGVVIIEAIFNIPGVGQYFVDGAQRRDFPVIQASVLIIGTGFVVLNFVADLLCAILDPRLRGKG